jgi:hypothetical protein
MLPKRGPVLSLVIVSLVAAREPATAQPATDATTTDTARSQAAPDAENADSATPGGPRADAALADIDALDASIRGIDLHIDNVFDTSNPEEDKRLYRWANRLHRRTRPHVIENILLFEQGEQLDSRLLEESERLLRAQSFVADTRITARDYDAETNSAIVDVWLRDAWSLEPDVKLSRGGGENEYGLGITDDNLLGLGKSMTVAYESDVDRDTRIFDFSDPNLRGSRTTLSVSLADMSDGRHLGFDIGRPFFALDTRWSVGGNALDDERVDPIYDLGEIVERFRHDTRRVSIEGGRSPGLIDGKAKRWLAGFTFDEDVFQPAANEDPPLLLPSDRKLVYPWLGIQILKDDFRQVTELNDMGRTEDIALGLNLKATLGIATETLGSDRNAVILDFSAARGWEPGGPGRLLLVESSATARKETAGTKNSIVRFAGEYYHRNFRNGLFSVALRTVLANALDAENQVLVGGDNGLRGYPLRYQSGERSAILTLEQRFFTDLYAFRLIRFGYAVFLDAGRVWGDAPRSSSDLGALYDVGMGLRLTSPRSSSRSIVHVDLAFPLNAPADIDNVQLSVERKNSF